MAGGGDLSRTRAAALVLFDMHDEVGDMVADPIVPISDVKSAQDPVELGFPVSLVTANAAAKRDDRFGISHHRARPDLDPKVPDRLALLSRSHSAFVRSVSASDVALVVPPCA